MTTPQPCSDRAGALDFIVACQQDPATGTAFLGEDRAGVEAELEGLDQPWLDTLRVVGRDGRLLAAVGVDWDEEPSMAWLHGPWGAPDAVREYGRDLVLAAVAQAPGSIRRYELCGHVENTAMAALAERLGFTATEMNLAMVVDAGQAAGWTAPEPRHAMIVRPAVLADRAELARLHTPEFGEAYATVDQLITAHRTVIAEIPHGRMLGYAAGRIQDDGSAYVDFTAVDPLVRRQGVGRQVVTALVRLLLAEGTPDQVHLTVRESRTAAQQLYLSLGHAPGGRAARLPRPPAGG